MTKGPETATAGGRPEAYLPSDNTLHVVPPETELPSSGGSRGRANACSTTSATTLASGEARTEVSVTVDGREALRIIAAGSQSTYLVDAQTYEPIELRDVADDGTVVTSRFVTYELLPATATNLALLSLRKQHRGKQGR